MRKWYHNSKTGEIDYFQQENSLTDFPRGVFLAYGDYLTTGFNSKQEAEEWAKEWGACEKCRSVRKVNNKSECNFCGGEVIFTEASYE